MNTLSVASCQVEPTTSISTADARPRRTAPAMERDAYGALTPARVLSAGGQQQLRALLDQAVSQAHLPRPFIESSKKEMQCLNHDIYDVQVARGKVRAVIVQVRTFWRHLRKTRTRLSKEYVLITLTRRKLQVQQLDATTCVKRARNTRRLGELVAHYSGGPEVRCKSPLHARFHGYKVVARDGDGTLRSVFDGSLYELNRWRQDAARPEHEGGLYYYRNLDATLDGVRRQQTFLPRYADGKTLTLCEVETAGRQVSYPNGKFAASRLRVTSVLVEDLRAHLSSV